MLDLTWVLTLGLVAFAFGGAPSAPPAVPPSTVAVSDPSAAPSRSDAEIQRERAAAAASIRRRRGKAASILAGETAGLAPGVDTEQGKATLG